MPDTKTIKCRCGQLIRLKDKHVGKRLACANCGAPLDSLDRPKRAIRVNEPPIRQSADTTTNPVVIEPVSAERRELPRTVWMVAWAFVGVVAISCLWIAVSYIDANRMDKIDAANDRIVTAIATANQWMVGNDLNRFEAVEQNLILALDDEFATQQPAGTTTLELVRQHRDRLVDQARIEHAKQTASERLAQAKTCIRQRQSTQAIELLQDYLDDPYSPELQNAISLLTQLQIAVSDQEILRTLVALDDSAFSEVEAKGTLADGRIHDSDVLAILGDSVIQQLPIAQRKRTEIRKREDRRLEMQRLEFLRQQAELDREREEEAAQRRRVEAELNALAGNPSSLEKYLHAGEFAVVEQECQAALLAQPDNDQLRFELGIVQFFQSIERLGQSLHRYGTKSTLVGVPFLRFPAPFNPTPAPIRYSDFRRIFDDLIRDLNAVEATLDGVKRPDVEVSLRLGVIRFDLDGDGESTDKLNDILKRMHEDEFAFLQDNEALQVNFDRGDVTWLRIYCHLLSGILDFCLAFDLEPVFDSFSGLVFADPNTRQDVEAVPFLRIVEPRRMDRCRRHLIAVAELNGEMWRYIRAEKDNNHEWLPNSKQQSMLGFTVNDDLVDSWLVAVDEVASALHGDRVVPRDLLERNGRGLNLKRLMADPPDRIVLSEDVIDLLDGKYFSDDPDIDVFALTGLVTNYLEWFD